MNTIHNHFFKILLIILISLFQFGCEDDNPETQKIPEIFSVSPISGEKYQEVTIEGEHFGNSTQNIKVLFNNVESEIVELDESKIIALVPRKAGTGRITIEISDTQLNGGLFTYYIEDVPLPFDGNICDIYGPSKAVPNDILSYEHESNNNNTIFEWVVQAGDIEIIDGGETEFTTVKFGDTFSGGTIQVIGSGTLRNCSDSFDIELK